MTTVNQSLTLMTSSNIDINDIMYQNRLASSVSNVGVGVIPEDFYVASIYRGGDDMEVISMSFYNEDFSQMTILDWELFGENFADKDHGRLVNAALTALADHKDATRTIDVMNFTVVVREDDVMEDVDFSDTICVIEMQDMALDPLEHLTADEIKAIQEGTSGGGASMDCLRTLDKEVTLTAGKDFYQDVSYTGVGGVRLLIVDGELVVDPLMKFSKVEGEPNIFLRVGVTALADGIQILPMCLR